LGRLLAHNKTIEKLDLSENSIGNGKDEDFALFADGLANNSTLLELNLGHCTGLCFEPIAERLAAGIKNNNTLKSLIKAKFNSLLLLMRSRRIRRR